MGGSIYICFYIYMFPRGCSIHTYPIADTGRTVYVWIPFIPLYMWICMQGLYELASVKSLDGLFVRHGRGRQKFFARRLSPSLFGHLCVCVCVCVCAWTCISVYIYSLWICIHTDIHATPFSVAVRPPVCACMEITVCIFVMNNYTYIYACNTFNHRCLPTVCTRRRMSIHIYKCVYIYIYIYM